MPGALRRWSTGSRRLALLFLVVLVPSAATLIWLGAQLVEQDRRLWADRDLERLEAAADIIVRSVARTLAAAVEQLPNGRLPDGALAVMLSNRGLRTLPPGRALWSPDLTSVHEAASTPFIEAETTEFRQTGDRGLSAYETFASSPDPVIRAGALLRLPACTGPPGASTAPSTLIAAWPISRWSASPACPPICWRGERSAISSSKPARQPI